MIAATPTASTPDRSPDEKPDQVASPLIGKAASSAVDRYKNDFRDKLDVLKFTVFLCGPSLDGTKASSGARRRIKVALEAEGFEVVLGENDGLKDVQLDFGLNAQDNELEFIRGYCQAVIIVADSPGSFSELGLFSWHFVHSHGEIRKAVDAYFAVVVDAQYQHDESYLNCGPIKAVNAHGKVFHRDFDSFNPKAIVDDLKDKRAVIQLDARRRPRRRRKKA